MKPPFALDLSEDGLALLFRVAEGWAELGHVSFDAPDLEARIADLRSRAEALAPGTVTTKLVLPESQILYTEVDAPGPDAASRHAQIAAALEGRTPYAVEDLVFDWSSLGGRVKVAVTARLTLEEAEAFAEAQGFNPVSFVAIPKPGRFDGEPCFGPARNAARYLPEGTRLDRDQDPVRRIDLPADLATALGVPASASVEDLAGFEPLPGDLPAADTAELAETDAAAAGAGSAAGIGAPGPSREAEMGDSHHAGPEDAGQALPPHCGNDPSRDVDSAPEAPFIAVEDEPEEGAEDCGAAHPPTASEDLDAPTFTTRRQDAPGTDAIAARLSEATARLHLLADAPGATAVHRESATRLAVAGTAITAPAIELPPTAATAHFPAATAARRKHFGRAIMTVLPEARHGTQAQLRERHTPTLPGEAPGGFGTPASLPRRTAVDRGGLGLMLTAALVLLMAAVALWSLWFGADPAPRVAAPSQDQSATMPEPGARSPDMRAVVEADAVPAPVSESAPLATVDTVPQPPAAADPAAANPVSEVAAPIDTGDAAATEAGTGAETIEPAQDAVNAALAEALSPLTEATTDTAALPPAEAELATETGSDTAAPAPDPGPDRPLGIWTGIPENGPAGAEESLSGAIAFAAGDALEPIPHGAAPAALPAAPGDAAEDNMPRQQPLPPPFGTVVAFGPDGRIVATPEGVITPEGFTLFSGKPPVVPAVAPRRGAAPTTEPVANGAPLETVAPDPLPEPVDPAHAARKPRLRPQAIVERASAARAAEPVTPESDAAAPAVTAPPAIEGALPPPVDPAHAARNPRARPATIVARAEAARIQADAIAAAAAAAARAEAEALASASRLAVASSQRPSSRPSGLAKAVEAAVAAAVAEPQAAPASVSPGEVPKSEPATAVAAAPAPQEIDEPEPVETVPNMPTTATVARQATVKNAIDLGKINLIGVYGSSANRRALIRMPSGRLIKVKIGDRLDGGKVAAIGDSELTYVKGGRSYTLKIQKNG